MSNQKMKRVLIVTGLACFAATLLFGLQAYAAQKKTEKEKRILVEFMRKKLGASNRILEGLVTEDFGLIQKGADELVEISSAEKWRISEDTMYRQHSTQFTRIAKQLQTAAKKKKIDGAALSWLEATMNCIECHKFVRGTLIADKHSAHSNETQISQNSSESIQKLSQLLQTRLENNSRNID